MADPDFIPQNRLIANITVAHTPTVTTTANHGYSSDQYIRLIVPQDYGMSIRYERAQITVTGNTTFTIDYDTTKLSPFVAPGGGAFTQAHVVPITGTTDNIAT